MTKKHSYSELELRIKELETELQFHKDLKQHLKNLALAVDQSSEGIAIVNLEGNLQYVNHAFAKMHGYYSDELVGKNLSIFHTSEQMPAVEAANREIKETGEFEGEIWHVRRDGSVFPTLMHNSLITDDAGKPIGILGTLRDITVRKQAELSVKYERDFIERVLNTSPAGISRVDAAGQVVYLNRRAEEILKFRSGDDGGPRSYNDTAWKITSYDGEPFPNDKLPFSIVKKTRAPVFGVRHAIEWPNGERILLSINAAPLFSSSGDFEGMVSTFEDVTEHEKTLEALQRSEERYSSMFEHMATGVAVYEAVDDGNDFIFKAFNSAAETITRISIKEALGSRLLDLFPHMDKSGLLGSLQRVWKTGTSEHIPPFFYKDGVREGWRENRIYKLPSGEVVALFDDVTEGKKTEIELKESEEKFRVMMESMEDAAYISSPDFRIDYMNPKMINLIGRDASGEPCHSVIYGNDEKCPWCVFQRIMDGEHVEYEIMNQKNKRYYSVSNSPVLFANGEVLKLTIFRDITEKKAIESQLRQARKMESIGTLTGGIAHDFNNILGIILGNTELALDDIPEWNPVYHHLKEIKTASIRATEIVRQLLSFSRKTDYKLKPINVVLVIQDALKFLRSTIPSTIDIRQYIEVQDETILADHVQINQMMMNLCINASQAMEQTGGSIDIKLERTYLDDKMINNYKDLIKGDYLKISIRDTGPGIQGEHISRIFDPYFTTKDVGKGSGMGLAVVHGIVKNHHGIISVDSEIGKGSTFTVLFPLASETPEKQTKMVDQLPVGQETILFVDDEEAMVQMVRQILERLGYQVETTVNPMEALGLFQEKHDQFDLVITDMTMPQMTGVKLSEKLKAIRSDIPIIICTGHSTLIDEQKAKDFGVSALLMKPIDKRNFAITVRKVLDEDKISV